SLSVSVSVSVSLSLSLSITPSLASTQLHTHNQILLPRILRGSVVFVQDLLDDTRVPDRVQICLRAQERDRNGVAALQEKGTSKKLLEWMKKNVVLISRRNFVLQYPY